MQPLNLAQVVSANGTLGGLDSWDPLMKGIVT